MAADRQPNLSTPALLQTAESGNTELAVILSGDQTALLEALPGREWEDQPLSSLAPLRHRQEQLAEAEQERIGSFNAWEDDAEIVVAGIPVLIRPDQGGSTRRRCPPCPR